MNLDYIILQNFQCHLQEAYMDLPVAPVQYSKLKLALLLALHANILDQIYGYFLIGYSKLQYLDYLPNYLVLPIRFVIKCQCALRVMALIQALV